MVDYQKCAVIGCGAVGATTAFTLLKSGLFSKLLLIDLDKDKAEGEAMDLNHSIPFVKPVEVIAGEYQDIGECGIVIITAGASQTPGETRTDLTEKNAAILSSIIKKIVRYNTECILLLVTNPVDVLTYAALKLSGFPPERVIGSGTVLDTARLKYMLGEHLNIDSRNIHAFIIGEHGDTEFPVWSSANVSGIDLDDFCSHCGQCGEHRSMLNIYKQVKNSAYEIIEKKGATFYAVSMAVLRIVEAIIRNEHTILPVCCLVDGHYGLDSMCMSLPAVIGREGIREIFEIPLDGKEQDLLKKSAQAVSGEIEKVKHLWE